MMLYIRDTLKDHYTKLPGVSSVSLGGWINRQVNIWVDNKKLNARYLTADDVVNTINTQHAEVPVGFMETPLTQYEVRSMGEAATIKDFEEPSDPYPGRVFPTIRSPPSRTWPPWRTA
jgi:multidrug efflux pump